uniref:Uncharacterized protein n=1 Tax=virus sp. ctx9V1 TaxID=2828001 RepID=A0A8S5RCV9_9VIRU|nr:MAG TPA: hypothetical protein [virus sp. ctx9V1]DAO74440.1 MAG TPA: hypothetical protein [Bacteriophage sp.]DAR41879.1 MAG TPA: hypothetical protein [Bacteriophage sp.]DAU52466.1 MAG TPA: hypothetical protein [Crassvirales sp.]
MSYFTIPIYLLLRSIEYVSSRLIMLPTTECKPSTVGEFSL